MGIEHHYEPCFASVPESVTDRWTQLREFISQWHNINLPLLRDPEYAAHDIEQTLNRVLPESIREWIAFSQDLIAIDAFHKVMRDFFEVTRMNRFSSTTLMIQGEDDVYWTVHDRNAERPDPPVDYLHRDFDTNEWTEGGNTSPSLTSFVLEHASHYLGPGFVRTRDIDESVIAKLDDAFPVAVDYDGLRVFEMTDLFCIVRKRPEYFTLTVAQHNQFLTESELPECLRRLKP
ncbi:hypothetical protein Pan241w_37610 [Gimesia alba]|uniref:Uncharacterized protein n=1 Tax=Gimesia alba TaxID=2527973 RepID=A0A517RIG6_9PLAN|nr:hypothetical protein [Gimesia alba]QDT43659.1 hypothetical protein Pan241w_37610 [Gimesia alba]